MLNKILAIEASLMLLLMPASALALPQQAVENSAVEIQSLGFAVDPQTGKVVEGLAFIHHKKAYNHKPNHGNKPGGGDTTSVCYSFLANGTKWLNAEPYATDFTNNEDLDPAHLSSLFAESVSTWENAANFDIFGDEIGDADGADETSPDGKNEVMFGNIDGNSSIAVTIVWGIFRGPSWNRELVEWDMVLDQESFDWSAEALGVPNKMDFQNIVTHELGHALGLSHPADSCLEETMYRYADNEEINKRDLAAGDIAGVNALY